MTPGRAARRSSPPPQPIDGERGATVLGPTNPSREAENPDRLAPPRTDRGTLPNLKWSFADSHNRLERGGWARQLTIRELPIATEISGVNMRLEAGAVREMHCHWQAEWAFMLRGRARITAVDQHLRSFDDGVGEGDLWYFPAGIPHAIQGLEGDGCEIVLAFDDGNFDEDSTFLRAAIEATARKGSIQVGVIRIQYHIHVLHRYSAATPFAARPYGPSSATTPTRSAFQV